MCYDEQYKLTLIRRHIKDHHSQASHHCVRCKRSFSTNENLHDHLRQPNPCQVRETEDDCGDPEDGITPEMASVLAGRKSESKIDTWEGIWSLVFPARGGNAEEIPHPSEYTIHLPHG